MTQHMAIYVGTYIQEFINQRDSHSGAKRSACLSARLLLDGSKKGPMRTPIL